MANWVVGGEVTLDGYRFAVLARQTVNGEPVYLLEMRTAVLTAIGHLSGSANTYPNDTTTAGRARKVTDDWFASLPATGQIRTGAYIPNTLAAGTTSATTITGTNVTSPTVPAGATTSGVAFPLSTSEINTYYPQLLQRAGRVIVVQTPPANGWITRSAATTTQPWHVNNGTGAITGVSQSSIYTLFPALWYKPDSTPTKRAWLNGGDPDNVSLTDYPTSISGALVFDDGEFGLLRLIYARGSTVVATSSNQSFPKLGENEKRLSNTVSTVVNGTVDRISIYMDVQHDDGAVTAYLPKPLELSGVQQFKTWFVNGATGSGQQAGIFWSSDHDFTTDWNFLFSLAETTTESRTVTFSEGDIPPRTIVDGQPIGELPELESTEAREFLGWSVGGTIIDGTFIVTEDVELIAEWREIPLFTVTFSEGADPREIREGQPIGELPILNRTSFDFLGWSFDGVLIDEFFIVIADITLTAEWYEHPPPEPDTFTVTFSEGLPPREVVDGDPIGHLPALQRDGYEWLGWTVNGTLIDEQFIVTADITVVANWRKIPEPPPPPAPSDFQRYLIVDDEHISFAIVTDKRIDAPKQKTAFVDVPGAHGSLDLSTVLTDGAPIFDRRPVEFDLFFKDRRGEDFFALQREWGSVLHGKILRVSYTGAGDVYLTGRCAISDWKETKAGTTCKFSILADPYWYDDDETIVATTAETGTGATVTLANGHKQVAPTIHPSDAMEIIYGGKRYSVQAGEQRAPWLVLKPGSNTLQLIGEGTCLFRWRKAWM